jgi:polysaccharide export outer membrane protein
MQGKFDTASLSQVKPSDPVVQKGDILSIIVYSDNPAATAIYNQPISSSSGGAASATGSEVGGAAGGGSALAGGSTPATPGYLVDELGNIQFQGLGQLHVEGMTRSQLREFLDSKLKNFLTNPYYTIRFLNYKVTMLGEVSRPGVYSIPGERLNLFEALGLAGDMTFYGRRDNILVIREFNGKREFGRMDITKPEIMKSPYFFLQQGDVVIVEATKKKVAANDQLTTRNVSLALSAVSVLAVVYSIFRK